jgi:hypothetical protein
LFFVSAGFFKRFFFNDFLRKIPFRKKKHGDKHKRNRSTSAKFNFFSTFNAFYLHNAYLYELFFMEKELNGDQIPKIPHIWKINTIYIVHLILK